MRENVQKIRDQILEHALLRVPFEGWHWQGICQAAEDCGYDRNMAHSVFPQGLEDVLDHLADLADREMMDQLSLLTPEEMRVRDRIKHGVLHRLQALNAYREAEKYAISYWAVPGRQGRAARILWRTSDRIWTWAGDTSTDYNYYTKRGLLSSVLASTTLAWLKDTDFDIAQPGKTHAFLDRRIDNVLSFGKTFGPVFESVFNKGFTRCFSGISGKMHNAVQERPSGR